VASGDAIIMQPESGMSSDIKFSKSLVASAVSGARELVDDCFLTSRPSMTHAEALAIFRQRIVGIAPPEIVALRDLSGRILAERVTSTFPVPAHTNSAVDGYAFATADYNRVHGTTFSIFGRVAAGHALTASTPIGSAVRIFTGAVMPPELDTVAMQEDCTAVDGNVKIPGGLKPGGNVRRAGEDVASATALFEVGHTLRPQDLAALASIGRAEVSCYRRLRVALVSTKSFGPAVPALCSPARCLTLTVRCSSHWHNLQALKPTISASGLTMSM
jgi:molybdopterin molybdotransferase